MGFALEEQVWQAVRSGIRNGTLESTCFARRLNSLGTAQASFAELIRHAPTSRAEASARMSDNPERSRWMGLRARRNHRYGKSSVHDGLPLSNRRYASDSIHPVLLDPYGRATVVPQNFGRGFSWLDNRGGHMMMLGGCEGSTSARN